jgi:hypothetical protein
VTIAIVAAVAAWSWKFRSANVLPAEKSVAETSAPASSAAGRAEFEKLKGRWLRPDGGYILAINSVAGNGGLDAAYFNPSPIHVAKAQAFREGDATKVFVELRDANYPGSTYTLDYDSSSDRLQGIYYQAVEQQRFEIVFERIK